MTQATLVFTTLQKVARVNSMLHGMPAFSDAVMLFRNSFLSMESVACKRTSSMGVPTDMKLIRGVSYQAAALLLAQGFIATTHIYHG